MNCFALALCLFAGLPAVAAVRYVNASSPAPSAPYTNWVSASRTIQQAIEASSAGDLILVTNGVYQTGGRTFKGASRAALTRPVTVQSVNGPAVTFIVGQRVSGTTNGASAIRCAYLTNGAMLAGFTLTNGATHASGAVEEILGGGAYCESTDAVLSNCVLTANAAFQYGAGSYSGTLKDCVLSGNTSTYIGGGTYLATLTNCTLTGNSAQSGGGAASSAVNNCTVFGNYANVGGGMYFGSALNSFVHHNSAINGGGAFNATLINCNVVGNTANSAGGVSYSTLTNCIVYYNTATTDPNHSNSTLDHTCTTPLPGSGTGNLAAEPELASASHLSANSPCLGAGAFTLASGLDIDGQPWANPPSIGCDEFYGGGIGPLTVSMSLSYTNVSAGYSLDFQALISGHANASRWEFGDGTIISNGFFASHAFASVGDYPVVLRAYNDTFPAGVTATTIVHVVDGVYYVAAGNVSPVAPYTSWATAATNIQHAIDAVSVPGATVLVTNGVYQSGGRTVIGGITNRVAVTKPLIIRSVNGPEVTVVQGYQDGSTPNHDGSVRCAYLAGGTLLAGFTLMNGGTRGGQQDTGEQSGGGVYCASSNVVVSNCVLTGNYAYLYGAGAYFGTLLDCRISGNYSVMSGGGAFGASLERCTVIGNSAQFSGGGTAQSTLRSCMVISNTAGSLGGGSLRDTLKDCTVSGNTAYEGGGACASTLTNCTLSANYADEGGGAYEGTLINCTVSCNSATYGGGVSGQSYGVLKNCALTDNSASYEGGGAIGATLINCTVVGNSAGSDGAGVVSCALTNCIVYYNTALSAPNWLGSTMDHCFATPLPSAGSGNSDADPELAGSSRLSANSPCIGRGNYDTVTGVDIDGQPWANPPSIGCDEFYSGSNTGALTLQLTASYTNVALGYPIDLQGSISGLVAASRWDLADGNVISNRPYLRAYSWSIAGDYAVTLRAYNDSYPAGVTATLTVHVVDAIHYVASGNPSPVAPYTSWETAATNIQDAVDAALTVGAVVIVTNGVYDTGGRMVDGVIKHRVTVDKLLRLRSANGPEFTIIKGYQLPREQGGPNGAAAIRCVYLTNGATLSGFTLTNGATPIYSDYLDNYGGALWCESTAAVVSNCWITGNSAFSGGGGAWSGTLNNCLLSGNSVVGGGGGAAYASTLNDCHLSGNAADLGGATSYCELNRCSLMGNWARQGGGASYSGTLTNCSLTGNSATNYGGGAQDATLADCILTGNSAAYGGAISGGILFHCTLNSNSASQSGGAVRASLLDHCTLAGNSAVLLGGGTVGGNLTNCTLTGNSAEFGGGAFMGYFNATLLNCLVSSNLATWGGGVYGGSLNNCLLTDNSAFWAGGAYDSALGNCTIFGNAADFAGGTYYGAVNNCIVVSNTAVVGENYLYGGFTNSCTSPLPTNGVGNIDLDPLFVDYLGRDLRLQPNSPSINSGRNAEAAPGADLDGNPRIAGGTIDIGAYEFQTPISVLPYAWLQQYGLPVSSSVDSADSDGDGASNWQEWNAGTVPTNALSVLRLLSPVHDVSGTTLTWQSVSNRTYLLERASSLGTAASFSPIGIFEADAGLTSFTDTNIIGSPAIFYRVRIQP